VGRERERERVAGFIRTLSIHVEPMGHSLSVTSGGKQGTATHITQSPLIDYIQ
jgi:hypothetical protein